MINAIEKLLSFANSPPDNLIPWLLHDSSLTEKLKAASGDANLQVLGQTWCRPNWWDKFTFSLTVESVIHRDIIMYSQKTPCWFARTIIPKDSFEANRFFFDRLNNESLGFIVFNEPTITRILLYPYMINNSCLEYHWLPDKLSGENQIDKQLWLRLSVFSLPNRSFFYLVEILLPGLVGVLK